MVGRTAEDFRVDTFDVSYGDPQKVAVIAKRALKLVTMQYRINGGRIRIATAPEWQGGERYGDENDDYYAERRGTVRGADPGDRVEVWFTGLNLRRGFVRSQRFTYTVQSDTGDDVLVIANEDYTGVNPAYPAGTNAPKYVDEHVAAIEASGRQADVWDVDAQGVPHDLGVLSHYDAIVWYLGDNRITQDPEDVLTTTPFGNLANLSVAEEQQYLTLAVRDFLNEGGKLVHAGETTQYEGRTGISDAVGGLYYGLNGDPTAECVVSSVPGFFEDCLILADDFRQYYLGGYVRTSIEGPTGVRGTDDPLTGFEGQFGGPVADGDNPLDEAGYFQPTSEVLPVSQFPQFASRGVAAYEGGNRPFEPVEGERFAYAAHADSSYMRLTKTVDLAGATNAQLQFELSLNSEEDYDHFIVEAHTVGQDNWTTLAEIGGATSTDPPAECNDPGFLLALHPNLRHYFTGRRLREPRHERGVELDHGRDRRLAAGGLRPVRLRGQRGRDRADLRHRPVHRRRRRVRRRHADRRRRRHRRRRLRRADQQLVARASAAGQPQHRQQLDDRAAAAELLCRDLDERHAAAGLRPGTAGLRRRTQRAHEPSAERASGLGRSPAHRAVARLDPPGSPRWKPPSRGVRSPVVKLSHAPDA